MPAKKYLDICNTDPCHQHIGLNATQLSKEEASIEIVLQPWHMNFEKCAHGGILSFLLDTTMGFCVYPHLVEAERILATDLKISYIKAATMNMGTITAHGRLVARTRRLAVSEGEIIAPGGGILCKGLGTYAILKKP